MNIALLNRLSRLESVARSRRKREPAVIFILTREDDTEVLAQIQKAKAEGKMVIVLHGPGTRGEETREKEEVSVD